MKYSLWIFYTYKRDKGYTRNTKMITDTNIYKYCSYDIGEIIISSQLIRFNNYKSFNDPFDCDINLLHFDLNENCEQEIQDELKKIEIETMKNSGISEKLYFEIVTKNEIEDILKRSQLKKLEESSISCFSKNYDNTCMWSHYGNNHDGICLVFNLTSFESPFEDIQTSEITQGPINYDKYERVNYFESRIKGITNLYLTKSNYWKYEEEYRYIVSRKPGFYKFKKEFLKGIIFGLKVTEDKIENFKDKCIFHFGNNLKFRRFYKNNLSVELKEI
ncbi:MAG: DUF2971 domain-containing protein [Bacteroidales bacterium]